MPAATLICSFLLLLLMFSFSFLLRIREKKKRLQYDRRKERVDDFWKGRFGRAVITKAAPYMTLFKFPQMLPTESLMVLESC